MLMNKILRYSFVALLAMVFGNSYAAWEKATSIAVGDVIVIAVDNGTVTKELKGIGMAGSNSIGEAEDYTGSTPAGLYPLTVVAGSQSGSFAFKNGDNYLSWTSGNTLTTSTEINDNSSWTVTFTDGVPTINNVNTTTRDLSYNASSPRFACYNNTNQTRVTLWKQLASGSVAAPVLTSATSFIESINVEITAEEGASIYYTLDGTDPTTASTQYTAAITLTETTTVKAIAAKGGNVSSVASATYTKVSVSTIAQAQAAEKGTTVVIEGVVVASAASGAVLYDGTDYMYYFNNANALNVGQKVRMAGALGEYGGAKQMQASATITELGTETVVYPTATTLATADFEAIVTAKTAERKYVTFEGDLSINGNYFNLAIGSESAQGSLVKPKEDLSAMNNQKVVVSGYLMYVNSKYVYVVATKVNLATNINTIKANTDVNAPVYNLAGQQVEKSYKGLVIKNGKKVINK